MDMTELSGSGSMGSIGVAVDFSDFQWIAIWGGICCFIVAFGIGANDVANAFATSVGAGSVSLRQAVVIAGIFEFLGAVTMGSRVTDTVRKGITSEEYFNDNEGTLSILMIGMCCVIMSVAIWLLLATFLEMPVSTTHSCIGGVIGMALAAKGRDAVNWEKVGMVIASWFISPILSAIIAGLIYVFVRTFVLRTSNSGERAYNMYPFLIGVTITINCFFIMYKGSPQLNLDETPVGRGIGISFGFGIGLAVLLHFFAVPWMRKRVNSKNLKTLAELEEETDATNMELGTFKALKTADEGNGGSKQPSLDGEEESRAGVTDDIDTAVAEAKVAAAFTEDVDVVKAKLSKARASASNVHGIDPSAVAAAFDNVQAIHDNAEKFEPKTEAVFMYLQVFTAIFAAFSHGANDVANAIGPFSAVWSIYSMKNLNETSDKVPVPFWILAMGGAGIVVGLGLYGYKIITVIGVKLTKITPSRGFAIELGSALVICFGSYLELPLSSTHCQVGATLGVAAFEGVKSGISWPAMARIAFGWVITLIFCAFLSAGLFSFAVYSPSMKYADAFDNITSSNAEL